MEQITFIEQVQSQSKLPFKEDQVLALEGVYAFLFQGGPQSIFVLKGYAGTGKTTLMGALIRWFHSLNRKTVLLAPTGRSAKVLSNHSGYYASTIHRKIYAVKQDDFGRISMQLGRNTSEKTIFIVDEASMIGEANLDDGYSGRSLLNDLIEYVYSGNRCRLILIGDDAQLPPVGMELSPALDVKKLNGITSSPVYERVLTQVVRQEESSLILSNATHLREQLVNEDYVHLKIQTSTHEAVNQVDGYELEDRLSDRFLGSASHEAVLICRSNKDAFQFNQQIRSRILFREEEVEAGDRMMIVKNNYHWKLPGKRQSFLANGDMITIDQVYRKPSFGPFRFAECQVHFTEDPSVSFDLILLLNAIEYEGPSIATREIFKLRECLIDSGEVDAADPEEKFFQNPYFQAVQVKYAYAITCHKSQGGQWEDVFLYQGYLTDEMLDRSYFRWLYTAITRATNQIHLIGFHPNFIEVI